MITSLNEKSQVMKFVVYFYILRVLLTGFFPMKKKILFFLSRMNLGKKYPILIQ